VRGSIAAGLLGALAGVTAAAGARADGAFPNSQNVMTPATAPHEIVLGTNFGLVTSFDDGRTWTWSCEQALNAFATLYQVGPPPAHRLFAVSPAGVIASDDVGCTWSAAADVAAGAALDVFADPTDAGRVLAITAANADGGALYQLRQSTDGGRTFATTLFTAAAGDHLSGVEIARAAPQTLYLTLTSGAAFTPKVAQSTDGGAHWTVHDLGASLPAGTYSISLIAVDPSDAGKLFLRVGSAAGEALAVSADGGTTALLPVTLPGGTLRAFARLDSGSLIVAGAQGTENVAFRSTDGGTSFQKLPDPPPLFGLSARGSTLYAATDTASTTAAVETSPDEGTTWQPLMAYADIQAIQSCVMAACQDDCYNRAGMDQWPEALCTATAPAMPLDAGAAAEGGAGGSPAPADAGGGCRCQAGTGGGSWLGLALLAVALVRRRLS
jgi:hypothetical protein